MRRAFELGIILLTVAVGTTPATALVLSRSQVECQEAIAKQGLRFLAGVVDLEQRCHDADLRAGAGACPASKIALLRFRLVDRLHTELEEHCAGGAPVLARLGFPGRCADPNPADGFTVADLAACLEAGTARAVEGVCSGGSNDGESCSVVADCPDSGPGTVCRGLISTEYDPRVVGPLASQPLGCQTTLADASSRFMAAVLKAVHRCRLDMLDCKLDPVSGLPRCKIEGIAPGQCAVLEPKTVATIAKAREKAENRIERKCRDDGIVAELFACEPDQTTGVAAATCETTLHRELADDFLAFEFPTAGFCGDGRVDQPSEECDRTDDGDCPGQCGLPSGALPCLCLDKPRQLVTESASADLDLGWTGSWHDSEMTNGGGYVTDLWDCDGYSGPDTLCTVGPSCSAPPHAPCSPPAGAVGSGDAICAALGQGTCRKTVGGAVGPHCANDLQRRCRTAADCPMPGDECQTTFHGPPLPLSAGGVAVCMVSTFTEDVTGTVDLATNAGTVRIAERWTTSGGGDIAEPCPVCGGFCAGSAATTTPGARSLCTDDADCPGGVRCVTEPICSYGPNVDQPCRTTSPYGGGTTLFGTPSVDCPPPSNALSTLDLVLDPLTTGSSALVASTTCLDPAFAGNACIGGGNDGRPCTSAAQCPGGSCNGQCFCSGERRPNACGAACVGGTHDGQSCTADAECDPPNGFCHAGDCRVDPADTDSIQEGLCTVGPNDATCAVHSFVVCASDADCRAPDCPFCQPDETCVGAREQCFVNGTIRRAGAPGVDRTMASTFCVPSTHSLFLDETIGLPGPGAITQPETAVGFGL